MSEELPAKFYTKAFEDHEIQEEGPNEYYWRRPGTVIYGVYILFKHGRIIMYGDLGPFVFNPGDPNPLSWAISSIKSRDYVLGKLRTHNQEYDAQATYDHVIEILDESIIESVDVLEEDIEEIRRLLRLRISTKRYNFTDIHDAYDEITDKLGLDYEALQYTWEANSDAMWAYWTLRTFVEAYKS